MTERTSRSGDLAEIMGDPRVVSRAAAARWRKGAPTLHDRICDRIGKRLDREDWPRIADLANDAIRALRDSAPRGGTLT